MASTAMLSHVLHALRSTTIFESFALVVGVTIVYNVLLIVYRLTLHPLARYPGRVLDKISIWPLIFDCYSGSRHLRIYEAHKRYGSVVRIGPNHLDFDTATSQDAIHRDRSTNVRKSDWYTIEPAFSGDVSVQTVIDKREHGFRRRVLQPAFSDSALREHEHFIESNVRVLLSKMGENVQADGWTSPKDFAVWSTFWGFDFISDLAFGSRFNLLEESTHRYLPDMLKWASHFIYYAGYLPYAPLIRFILRTPLLSYLPHSGASDGQKYFSASEKKLEERHATEDASKAGEKIGRKDIFHYLIQSRDPVTGLGFTHEQLTADSGLLIGAGSDAVAVTVAAAVFYLLKNPSCMEKMTDELRTAFQALDDVRSPKLRQLPYLNGVVQEALRLAPGVPSGFPREVLPGGLDVDGLHLPAGTVVSVSPYSVHHNEDCFSDSFAFRPERWCDAGEDVSLARRALCTFSAGRFDCVGRNIAVLACKLVLAKLFFAYDLRGADSKVTGGGGAKAGEGREREDEYQLLDYAVSYRSGPMVELKPWKGVV